jgi:hypothetical protein
MCAAMPWHGTKQRRVAASVAPGRSFVSAFTPHSFNQKNKIAVSTRLLH